MRIMTMRQVAGVFLLMVIVAGVCAWQAVMRPAPLTADPSIRDAVLAFVSDDLKLLKQEEIAFKRLEIAKGSAILHNEIASIPRWAAVRFWGFVTMIGSVALSLVLVASGAHRAMVKARQIHEYQIGGSTIIIHERDLGVAAQIALGLVNAENLRQTNGGMEQALALCVKMAEIQKTQLSALARSHSQHIAMLPEMPQEAIISQPVPTMQELLQRREIATGRPLIVGFEKSTGQPLTGRVHDLYSTIAVGMSGVGKSTYLAYLIACAVYLEGARVMLLDFHFPAPESLGYLLQGLIDAGRVQIESNPFQIGDVLAGLEAELDARLRMQAETTPLILVVDEHERWAANSVLIDFEMRVVNEGRKVNLYLFLTTKSAKADKIGDSALRDGMNSSFVFHTKKANARTFFKDEEKVRMLKDVTPPGEALYTNRKDESVIIRTPLTTQADIQQIAALLPEIQVIPTVAKATSPKLKKEADIIDQVRSRLTKKGDFAELSRQTGLDQGYLSRVLNRKQAMSENTKEKLLQFLTS